MDKVSNILLQRIIERAEETKELPWEYPWKYYNAFNWLTHHVYNGINRWLLPSGEYMTKIQFNKYNATVGKRYTFRKGIKWFPVLFSKWESEEILYSNLPKTVREFFEKNINETVVSDGYFIWLKKDGRYFKCRRIRKYYYVAERKDFVDKETGEPLPSKLETGEVEICFEEPYNIIDTYFKNTGIKRTYDDNEAYFSPRYDTINVPPVEHFKSEQGYLSTMFHEMGHSTGVSSRLNRRGYEDKEIFKSSSMYSREELVAEFTSALLCAETGVEHYESDNEKSFESHTAYVQMYMQSLKNLKDDIVNICSDAEKAFKFILNGGIPIVYDDTGVESAKK